MNKIYQTFNSEIGFPYTPFIWKRVSTTDSGGGAGQPSEFLYLNKNYQVYVELDISEFIKEDTITKTNFILFVRGFTSERIADITFKIFELTSFNDYNHMEEQSFCNDVLVFEKEYYLGIIAFDITSLVKRRAAERYDKVYFRIWNNSNQDFELVRVIDGEPNVSGAFFTTAENPKRISHDINMAGIGLIDISTHQLSVVLPEFNTRSKLMPLTFCANYAYLQPGFLGRGFRANFEYRLTTEKGRLKIADYSDDYRIFVPSSDSEGDQYYCYQDESKAYYRPNDYLVIEEKNHQTIHFDITASGDLRIKRVQDDFNNQIDYSWENDLLVHVNNNEGEAIDLFYWGNRIRQIVIPRDKFLMTFTYSSINSQYHLNGFKTYYYVGEYENDELQKLSEVEYEYLSGATVRLKAVKDVLNNIRYAYTYDNESSNVKQVSTSTGLKTEESYRYDNSKQMATIENGYSDQTVVYFDYGNQLKWLKDENNQYYYFNNVVSYENQILPNQEQIKVTHFNEMRNSDYSETSELNPGKPRWFDFTGLTSFDHLVQNTDHSEIVGERVMKLTGDLKTVKLMEQTVFRYSGVAGDEWTLMAFAKGHTTANQLFQVHITFYYNDDSNVQRLAFNFEKNSYDFTLLSKTVKALYSYQKIKISILYLGANDVYIGQVRFYQGGGGMHYDYLENGSIGSANYHGKIIDYDYDTRGRLKRWLTSNGDITTVKYNRQNQPLEIGTIGELTKVIYQYDQRGNEVEELTINNKGEYLETRYQYNGNNCLTNITSERGNQIKYHYDPQNRLTDSTDSNGLSTHYQYGEYSNIRGRVSQLNDFTDGSSYQYNNHNQIHQITTLNGTSYRFHYDQYERLAEIFINGISFQTLSYNHQINHHVTDMLTSKGYGHNDYNQFHFSYDERKRLKEIAYDETPLYRFNYNMDDSLSQITDLNNDQTKHYQYDTGGNLIKIEEGNNEYLYFYDNLKNVQTKNLKLDDFTRSYNYDYDYEYAEYHLKGYLARLGEINLNDYLIASSDGGTIYGSRPVSSLFELINDSSCAFQEVAILSRDDHLSYDLADINQQRINLKRYNKLLFEKDRWDEAFRNHKTIYGWIKPLGDNAFNTNIFSFRDSERTVYQLRMDSNGYLVIVSGGIVMNSYFPIQMNQWNLIEMNIVSGENFNNITISLNGFNYSPPVNGLFHASTIESITIGLNTDYPTFTPFNIVYLSIGVSSISEQPSDVITKIYQEGLKYLNGFGLQVTSSIKYYNPTLYQAIDLVTLNGTLISSNGKEPLDYSYTDINYQAGKNRLFEYDRSIQRFVYGSYDDYVSFTEKANSLLSYYLGLKKEGTISITVRPTPKFGQLKRYLLKSKSFLKDIPSKGLGLYIDSVGKIHLEIGDHPSLSQNQYLEDNIWQMVTIIFTENHLSIKVNEEPLTHYNISGLDLEDCLTYIGTSINHNGIPINHLNGQMERLWYTTDLLSESRINQIYQEGSIIEIQKSYDESSRLTKQVIKTSEKTLTTHYHYYEKSKALNLLPTSEVLFSGNETIYAYETVNGNTADSLITHKVTLSESGDFLEGTYYHYDELQRISEESHFGYDNQFEYRYTYRYDSNGNILTKMKQQEDGTAIHLDEYHYNSQIKDRLEKIARSENNTTSVIKNIRYSDNPFFPSQYGEYQMKWEGRRLKEIESPTIFERYFYNEEGIRIKTVGEGYTICYTLEGSKIIKQAKSITGGIVKTIYYNYDENNQLIGLHALGKEYFYIRDITGNINQIVDSKGHTMVYYKYTSYGEPLAYINDSLPLESIEVAEFLKENNSYLYKGYCYDYQTKLYYLNTRFYDSLIGRFISPDDIAYLNPEVINGLNLYAYCGNNPVMFSDGDGCFPVLAFLAGLAISWAVTTIASNLFGAHLVGGISSTVGGIQTIGVGISLLAFGPVGWVLGGIAIVSGAASIAFGTAELQEHFTGSNYMKDSWGMSDGWYNGLMIGNSILGAAVSIGGMKYMSSMHGQRAYAYQNIKKYKYTKTVASHTDRPYLNSIETQKHIIKNGDMSVFIPDNKSSIFMKGSYAFTFDGWELTVNNKLRYVIHYLWRR